MRDDPNQPNQPWPAQYPDPARPRQPQPYGPNYERTAPLDPYQGQGGGGGAGGWDDASQGPPPYQPDQAQYPPQRAGGRPPQWPGPGYAPQPQPRQSAGRPVNPPPLPRAYRSPAPAPAPQRAPQPAPGYVPRLPLPRFHIAHVFLVLGVAALAYALSQPWGTSSDGTPVFVRSFDSPRLNTGMSLDLGDLAVRTGTFIVGAIVVLSAVLILVNLLVAIVHRVLGVVGLSGCASLVFVPVLWGAGTLLFFALLLGAGFGGLGFLSNLPAVSEHGFSNVAVAHPALGFYLWWGGLVAAFVGMAGEVTMRH